MASELDALKVGDKVWVGDENVLAKRIETIVRITKTAFVLEGEAGQSSYSRRTGYQSNGFKLDARSRNRINWKVTE